MKKSAISSPNEDRKKLAAALEQIIYFVHPGREREWHMYPTRLRDNAVRVLQDCGFPVKDYAKCMKETEAEVAKTAPYPGS